MAVKTEKELSEGLRALWLKAVSAIELRNFGYAISLLQEILKQEPEFLTGRQLLRRAEVTKSKSAKKRFFNISTASIGVMKAQRELKKDPKRTIEMLEEVLESEPYNRQANLLLKEAAVAAGWSEIGVFALKTLLEENPRDAKVLHELGRLYHDAWGPRKRSGNLQSTQRDRSARCAVAASWQRRLGARFDEKRWLDAG